jgi:phosphatidylserine decarboxylase
LSERNEKLHLTYRGGDVEVTMIAGVLARVITGYVDTGETVDRGERVGHIAFGSRTDVLLPAGVAPGDVEVGPGESTTAGETVILGPEAFERATEQKRDGKDGKTRTVVGTGDDAETIKE